MGIEIVDVLIDCVRLGRVALKVEGPPVPFWILVHNIAELSRKRSAGLGPPARRAQSSSVPGSRRGKRVGAIRGLTLQGFEVDVTALWILDQTVL